MRLNPSKFHVRQENDLDKGDGREGVAKDGMEGVEASPSKDDLSDLVSLKAGTHEEFAECGMEILQWSS